MPHGPLQEVANVHVWAEVFEWLSGALAGSFVDMRNLRAACRKGVQGFDVAVHSGGIAMAAHAAKAGVDAEATCQWVDGWAPFHVRGGLRGGGIRSGEVVVRLELNAPSSLSLVPPTIGGGGDIETRVPDWRVPSVVVCETRAAATTAAAAEGEAIRHVAPILASCQATRLAFHNLQPATTTLGYGALIHRAHLEHIDLSRGLNHITRICDNFLALAQKLVRVDTVGLEGVTAIDAGFLSCCPSLEAVDLGGLGAVERIGNSFLSQSRALKALDTAPLKSLTHIHGSFLFECSGLEHFDASGLTSVTSVGPMFLGYCTGLRALDTAGMEGVVECGDDFIAGCCMPAENFVDTAAIVARLGGTMHHNREPRRRG